MRLIKLTDTTFDANPVLVDAELVRVIGVRDVTANKKTYLLQQDSDEPVFVSETPEQVLNLIEGR